MISADDMYRIQSLVNAGQFDDAAQHIFQVKYGMTPDQFQQEVDKEHAELIKHAANIFTSRHSQDYYPTKENEQTMFKYMLKHNLDPFHVESFEFAFANLKDVLDIRPEPDKPAKPEKQPWEKYTKKEIEAMKSDEYYKKIVLPEFKATRQPTPQVQALGISLHEPEESAEDFRRRVLIPEIKAARQAR